MQNSQLIFFYISIFPAEKKTIDTIRQFVMVLLFIMGIVLVLMETAMDPVLVTIRWLVKTHTTKVLMVKS